MSYCPIQTVETISIIPASKVAFAAGNSREDIIIFATPTDRAAMEKMLEAALQQVYIPTKTKANLQSHTDGGIDQKNGGISWAKYRISKLDVTAILAQSKVNFKTVKHHPFKELARPQPHSKSGRNM